MRNPFRKHFRIKHRGKLTRYAIFAGRETRNGPLLVMVKVKAGDSGEVYADWRDLHCMAPRPQYVEDARELVRAVVEACHAA